MSTTPAAVAVALAESVKLPKPFAASVAPLGIPGPAMVCPAARPNELDTPVTVALPLVVDPMKYMEHAGTVGPVPGATAMIGTNVSVIETVPEGVPFPCDTNVVTPMPKVAPLRALGRRDVLAADMPIVVGACVTVSDPSVIFTV